MSNRENPSAGYLIEAAKLAVFLSDDHRSVFHEALTKHDFDKALSLLDRAIPNGVACPTQIFILGDTDTGDGDLEQDTPYAFFDEEDLYEVREKADLVRLREEIGEAPTSHSWTIWG